MGARNKPPEGRRPGKRIGRPWNEDDFDRSPVVWFMRMYALLGTGDRAAVDRCLVNLERLGFFVVPYPPRPGTGQGAALKGKTR